MRTSPFDPLRKSATRYEKQLLRREDEKPEQYKGSGVDCASDPEQNRASSPFHHQRREPNPERWHTSGGGRKHQRKRQRNSEQRQDAHAATMTEMA